MKKISIALSFLMITFAGLFASCAGDETAGNVPSETVLTAAENTFNETSERLFETTETTLPEMSETISETQETTSQTTVQTVQTTVTTTAATAPETTLPQTAESSVTTAKTIDVKGSYTSPEDVAEYIHTFGTLPENFITKEEARVLGWDSKAGNLRDVAPGKSIGGDYFGNYEGLLPAADGRKYTECDVNYDGGHRGGERIVFSNDGLIYYTADHYESFEQLY